MVVLKKFSSHSCRRSDSLKRLHDVPLVFFSEFDRFFILCFAQCSSSITILTICLKKSTPEVAKDGAWMPIMMIFHYLIGGSKILVSWNTMYFSRSLENTHIYDILVAGGGAASDTRH